VSFLLRYSVGGDEFGGSCWDTDPKVLALAKEKHLTNSTGGFNLTLMLSYFGA
jgi:hypothetical protein